MSAAPFPSRAAATGCFGCPSRATAAMVRAGAFELHVLVGGVKQAELVTPDGKAYVESLFAVPGVSYKVASRETDPYGEEFLQEWPVTPYTLRVVNHSGDTAYANVYIDGSKACSQYLHAGDNEVKGFKDSTGRSAAHREFVFTPPRRIKKGENPEPQFDAAEKAALKAQLESIRVEVFECKFQRTEERFVAATAATGMSKGMEAVNKAVAKAADAAAATCAGREVAGRATQAGKVKYTIYDISKTACAELLLRYSQRRKLENLGLLEPSEASGERKAVPRSRKTAAAEGAAGAAEADESPFPGKKARVGSGSADAPLDLS